jgi:hypothetical protein
MAGIDYERYRMQQALGGVKPMAKGTWYQHADEVYGAIVEIAESEEKHCLQRLHAEGRPLVFCGDASWSHRRPTYDARQSWWVLTVILMKSREVKSVTVFEGNYSGSSRGMEGASFDRAVQKLKAAGVVQQWHGFVCDQDSSVHEQLRADPDTAHVALHWDPGHIKRNFQRKLNDIYNGGKNRQPRKRYQGLAARGGQQTYSQPPLHTHSVSHPITADCCCDAGMM